MKTGIGKLTSKANNELAKELQKYFDVQHLKDSQIRETKDCSQIIQTIRNELKTAQYQLSRLVCADDETHIVLGSGRELSHEVVPNTYMYFKINVANKSLGRLLISYGKNQQIPNALNTSKSH